MLFELINAIDLYDCENASLVILLNSASLLSGETFYILIFYSRTARFVFEL